MNLFRKRFFRLPMVTLGVAAWLAISNHCAIAAVEGAAKMPMPSCHGGAPLPAKQSPARHDPKTEIECCKVLRAMLLTFSKDSPAFDHLQFVAVTYVMAILPMPEHSLVRSPLELDTGPPFAGSFAESVLQRSLLAHAPPSLS